MSSNVKQVANSPSYKLTEQDWRYIEVFKKRAQELNETKIFSSDKIKIAIKLEFTVGKLVRFQPQLPSERDLKELFLAFRFFYLQKEPSNFGNGLNPLIVLCVAIRKFLIIMMFDIQANDRIM